MFKKFPAEKPEENQKVIAIHNGESYATEFARYNVRVEQEELPEGLIYAIRKSKDCWFMDIKIQKEQIENVDSIEVLWCVYPEEADKLNQNQEQKESEETDSV